MTTGSNPINNNQQISAVLASDSAQDKLESNSQKRIAEALIKESDTYSLDSNNKKEQAHQYLAAADALEKMAQAVRVKAEQLKKGEINKTEATEKVVEVVGTTLQMPVPKDATPEQLESIADALEEKARDNRARADDLLKQAEQTAKLSSQLKEQAEMIVEKEMNLSDLRLKSALSHNEGLRMVFEKLGIYRLDAMYKEQVAYAERKANEASQNGQ